MRNLALALLAAASLSACAVGPDYERPAFEMPDFWPWSGAKSAKAESPQFISAWWTYFDDPALTSFIEEGLAANTDLAVAAARVAQARAILTSRESALYPTLYGQGNAIRTRNSGESRFSGFAPSTKPYNDFGFAAILDYELDLWGRLRRASESARAQLLSSQANRDAVQLAVASDIAGSYFNLLNLEAQTLVTENTIRSREAAFEYQSAQYRYGAATGLTQAQAQAELAAAKAQLPLLLQARQEQETAFGLLLGRSPKDIAQGISLGNKPLGADKDKALQLDALPEVPAAPNNIPSTLLERRPDIQAAEQALIAANADIGVARADYFPRVSLSALIGLSGSETNRVFQSAARRWQFGADFTTPIIDIGRIASNIEGAEARRDEALARYSRTVAGAFKETLDAMAAQATAQARALAQEEHVRARAEALRLAGLRYDAGYSNYLEVLDAQRFLYAAQVERITARRDKLTAAVGVFKAISGGWEAQ